MSDVIDYNPRAVSDVLMRVANVQRELCRVQNVHITTSDMCDKIATSKAMVTHTVLKRERRLAEGIEYVYSYLDVLGEKLSRDKDDEDHVRYLETQLEMIKGMIGDLSTLSIEVGTVRQGASLIHEASEVQYLLNALLEEFTANQDEICCGIRFQNNPSVLNSDSSCSGSFYSAPSVLFDDKILAVREAGDLGTSRTMVNVNNEASLPRVPRNSSFDANADTDQSGCSTTRLESERGESSAIGRKDSSEQMNSILRSTSPQTWIIVVLLIMLSYIILLHVVFRAPAADWCSHHNGDVAPSGDRHEHILEDQGWLMLMLGSLFSGHAVGLRHHGIPPW